MQRVNGVAREDARACTIALWYVITHPNTAPTATTAATTMTMTTITACLMMASLESFEESRPVDDDDAVGITVGALDTRVGAVAGVIVGAAVGTLVR